MILYCERQQEEVITKIRDDQINQPEILTEAINIIWYALEVDYAVMRLLQQVSQREREGETS